MAAAFNEEKQIIFKWVSEAVNIDSDYTQG
jgi:hypothetical protein